MSILNPTPTDPIDQLRRQLLSGARSSYKQLRDSYSRSYAAVWNHPSLTPEEVLIALDEDAAEFIELAQATYTFLMTIKPDDDLPSPMLYPIILHDDGTASIDRPSSSSSESSSSSSSSSEPESDSTQH